MSFPYSTLLKNSLKLSVFACAILTVNGCHEHTNPQQKEIVVTDAHGNKRDLKKILAENQKTPAQQTIKEGVEALTQGDLDTASQKFNIALANEPSNAWLHYLNGLAYQLKAEKGDIQAFDLAASGYEQSLKFNPTNTMAYLQLGRVKAKQKDYWTAQDQFAHVLMIEPNNADALYELASASYLGGDLKTAQMAINRLLKKAPVKPETLKAAALIHAAAGKGEQALAQLNDYRKLAKNDYKANQVKTRVEDWNHLYKSGIMLAQAPDAFDEASAAADAVSDPSAAAPAAPATPGKKAPPKTMVVVDAMVLRLSEEGTTSKGQNILDGFTMTLAPGTHLYGRTQGIGSSVWGGTNAFASPSSSTISIPTTGSLSGSQALSVSRIFTQGITFGNVSYSMNIANVTRNSVEVVGRPTLVASEGQPAKFFSGNELMVGLLGQNGGNLVKQPLGVTLEITPVAINEDKVILDVKIYGSLISDATIFAGTIPSTGYDPTKNFTKYGLSKVNTRVEVGFGETIMLGGLTERIDLKKKTGFPILQDIPGLQYLFSNETTDSQRKSVMYLMTPRRHDENKRAVQEYFKKGMKRPILTELEKRQRDWYRPEYNTKTILAHLESLYREFRTGDLDPLVWTMPEQVEEQTAQALSFLYY